MGTNGLVALGEAGRGLERTRRARNIAPDEPMLLYNLGCIYSLAVEIEEAIDTFDGAKTRFSNRGKKRRSVLTLTYPGLCSPHSRSE